MNNSIDDITSRYPWKVNTLLIYILSFIARILNPYVYVFIVFGQVGLLVATYFYMKNFVDDIRYHLTKNKNITESEMKKLLIDIIHFQLTIQRFVVFIHFIKWIQTLLIILFVKIFRLFDKIQYIFSGTIFLFLMSGVSGLAATLFSLNYVIVF